MSRDKNLLLYTFSNCLKSFIIDYNLYYLNEIFCLCLLTCVSYIESIVPMTLKSPKDTVQNLDVQ